MEGTGEDEVNAASGDPIAELLTCYSDLNSSNIHEMHDTPSALEFMRFGAANRPFVIRGGTANWKATRKWSASYLQEVLGNQPINVAVTPMGNADSPTARADGTVLFVKPWEENEPFDDFLRFVMTQELGDRRAGEVRYAQTRESIW
ncbi:MAG: hypothetical protein M1818_007322 [Claussenomyces sp. TS43310]|nr:MAG: hypothetical protein M1818_007322 [Claussenomyces sp. TS43310]